MSKIDEESKLEDELTTFRKGSIEGDEGGEEGAGEYGDEEVVQEEGNEFEIIPQGIQEE